MSSSDPNADATNHQFVVYSSFVSFQSINGSEKNCGRKRGSLYFSGLILTLKRVKCCNEKLWARTISLIESLSYLLWLISSKQARNYMSRKSEKLLDKQHMRGVE
jgi:hypothetical protein